MISLSQDLMMNLLTVHIIRPTISNSISILYFYHIWACLQGYEWPLRRVDLDGVYLSLFLSKKFSYKLTDLHSRSRRSAHSLISNLHEDIFLSVDERYVIAVRCAISQTHGMGVCNGIVWRFISSSLRY